MTTKLQALRWQRLEIIEVMLLDLGRLADDIEKNGHLRPGMEELRIELEERRKYFQFRILDNAEMQEDEKELLNGLEELEDDDGRYN